MFYWPPAIFGMTLDRLMWPSGRACGENWVGLCILAPLADAHLLRQHAHMRRQAFGDVLALAEFVNRDSSVVTTRHHPEDVLRAKRCITAEESF